MVCPFRIKTVTKDNGVVEDNKVTKETEYMPCYGWDCPYYNSFANIKCKKAEKEINNG